MFTSYFSAWCFCYQLQFQRFTSFIDKLRESVKCQWKLIPFEVSSGHFTTEFQPITVKPHIEIFMYPLRKNENWYERFASLNLGACSWIKCLDLTLRRKDTEVVENILIVHYLKYSKTVPE